MALTLLVLSSLSLPAPVHAQSGAPAPDARTVKVVETALERAARIWGTSGVVGENAAGGNAVGVATPSGALFTGEAAAAGVALAQASCLLVATGLTLHVHVSRSGSIVTYGNPYGVPSDDIAFPLKRHIRAQGKPTAPPASTPYPIPEPTPAPKPGEETPDEPRLGRIYATYTRYHQTTERYYSGRTSMVIDLDKPWREQAEAAVLKRQDNRQADENADPKSKGLRRARLDEYAVGFAVDYAQRYRDAGYLAVRGREQQLIDFHGARRAKKRGIADFRGGAHRDTAPGEALTENVIRGVARDNPFGQIFYAAANLAFGPLAPYTGDRRYP